MASQYKLEVDTEAAARTPYHETITGNAEAISPQEAVRWRRAVQREVHLRIGPEGPVVRTKFIDVVSGEVI